MNVDRPGAEVLADRARHRLPAIVDDLMERQLREVPEFFVTDDPAYRQAVRRSTEVNSDLMLEAIARPELIPRALPPGPRLEADVAAQHAAPVQALLRTYRLGQQAMVEHLIDELDRDGVDGVARPASTLRGVTRSMFEYMEVVMPLVAREYGAERTRLQARPDLRALRLVQAALAGDESVALDYPMTGPHCAVVGAPEDPEAAIAAAAHGLGVAWLAVRSADGRLLAWLATRDAAELRERLRAEGLGGPAGVGGPAEGFAGFRSAHRQAQLAERVARTRGEAVVDVRASSIEALALGSPRTAWEIAHAELGPLAGADPASSRLRTTLEAWFEARERLAPAAAALGVAPRTVTYRLRRAEAVMGSSIAGRRAELETALRVVRLFADEPPPPGL